jgi:uncharacterized protein YecE (DUF72 family)
MIEWKIGCSGFHYPEWKGNFYPHELSKNSWFEFYCRHFNSIELNVTFYRFPRVEFLSSWYKRSPSEFKFSVKAPRLITHFKKLKDSQKYLSDFYSAVNKGLKEKAGCVLFQFPSNFQMDEEKLERIVSMLDRSFMNVVEFRHSSWWHPKVYDALTRNQIIFSGMSHPELSDEIVRTGDVIYYRLHGVPHLYNSNYDGKSLEDLSMKISGLPGVNEAFIYFNNTASGAAITDGKQFIEITSPITSLHK